jgi:uncharacterized membrane protein
VTKQEDVMQGVKRKVIYVGGYELLGLAVGTMVMTVLTGKSPATTGLLALMITGIATVWNVSFNYLFEAWELIAWWLGITLTQAFVLDLVFIVYIPFYTFAYNWAFDRCFGVPSSAVNHEGNPHLG